ncbi:ABC transporter substrate-binding protein, partial [Streptomyces sp. NPDC058052]
MTKEIKQNVGTVEVPDTVESAVALEYSFVEALVKLDVNVTGIADDNNVDNLDSETRKNVGSYQSVGHRQTPSVDDIKNAEPQVIFADEDRHKSIFEDLNSIAPTVLVKSF